MIKILGKEESRISINYYVNFLRYAQMYDNKILYTNRLEV